MNTKRRLICFTGLTSCDNSCQNQNKANNLLTFHLSIECILLSFWLLRHNNSRYVEGDSNSRVMLLLCSNIIKQILPRPKANVSRDPLRDVFSEVSVIFHTCWHEGVDVQMEEFVTANKNFLDTFTTQHGVCTSHKWGLHHKYYKAMLG